MPATQPGIQQVRPRSRREFMDKLVVPTDPQYGNPNIIYSEPFKPGQPEFNRAFETSVQESPTTKFSIGIKDADEAILYYFDNLYFVSCPKKYLLIFIILIIINSFIFISVLSLRFLYFTIHFILL